MERRGWAYTRFADNGDAACRHCLRSAGWLLIMACSGTKGRSGDSNRRPDSDEAIALHIPGSTPRAWMMLRMEMYTTWHSAQMA